MFVYCLLLKIKNWKHCNKIIFKCVNSTVRPMFNKSFAEKRGLWVLWTVHGIHWQTLDTAEKSFQLYLNVHVVSLTSSHYFFFLFFFFTVTQKITLTYFYCYLKDGLLLKIRPIQIKHYEKPKPTYSFTYYDPSMIFYNV